MILITFALPALVGLGACKPATGDAAALLQRAASTIGVAAHANTALHWQGIDVTQHFHESDRSYAPYLSDATNVDAWYDPATGVERSSRRIAVAGQSYGPMVLAGNGAASFVVRDTAMLANGAVAYSMLALRPLNVLAVMYDWSHASDVRVTETCTYRDYERTVLERHTATGTERLYLDPKSGFPIKLDRIEPHYLWGQVHAEYVYSTWQRVGDGYLPGESFRIADGKTEIDHIPASERFVSLDSAPRLTLPSTPATVAPVLPGFLTPARPDTVRVSANTVILRNAGYGEVVTLARDTVYIFDATQSEARARLDSAWIGTLFPGRHPIAVVVTDLAWPHVAGVRFWVARGATIVSHRAARAFLQSVVDRRWTLAPDLLERTRATVKFKFVSLSAPITLGGGSIRLFPIDGASSEVALAAYVVPDRFLWASDFIQSLDQPTTYVDEVWRATQRNHIEPLRFAAEHTRLAPWSKVRAVAPVN